jgi:hypothetical protein
MTEEQGRRAGAGQWLSAIVSSLSGDTAGVGKKGGRPGWSAEQLVVTCLVVGVILVIAVILVSAMATARPS